MRAILLMLERHDEQEIGREFDLHLAEPIPEDVKRFVFERDGGRCQACGSDELIQYSRVIPPSTNGGNEFEDVRLLCAECIRQ